MILDDIGWYLFIFIYIYLSSVVGIPNFSGQEKPQETSLKWAELLEKAMDPMDREMFSGAGFELVGSDGSGVKNLGHVELGGQANYVEVSRL